MRNAKSQNIEFKKSAMVDLQSHEVLTPLEQLKNIVFKSF